MDKLKKETRTLLKKFANAVLQKDADKAAECEADILNYIQAIQVEAIVKPVACGQWQKTKPDKPCYFIHRYKRNDNKPDLLDAILDENILCVTNIQDDEFVCTMEEFVDDGEFHIVEYH